jgi:hypothetical protein
MLNFNDRYTTLCASSIQNGLSPMVIVQRANLMNRALLSCLDSRRRNGIDRSLISYQKKIYECVHNKTCLMASRSAALTGGDFTLVRNFQPINWNNDRTPRRLVRHLVDDVGNHPGRDRKGMNKVIEEDFLPRGTNTDFPSPIQSTVRKGKKEGAS